MSARAKKQNNTECFCVKKDHEKQLFVSFTELSNKLLLVEAYYGKIIKVYLTIIICLTAHQKFKCDTKKNEQQEEQNFYF